MTEKLDKKDEKNLDEQLEEIDVKFSPDRLRKLLKVNILKKINAGDTSLLPDLERLEKLEKKEDPLPDEKSTEKTEPEYGIPERLRINRRPYTLTAEAIEQRRRAAKSPKKAEAMKGNKNAWKTGEHAQGFIRQTFRPCKSSCSQYPCSLVQEGEAEPGDLCADKVELVKALQAIEEALKNNKFDDFKDLIAVRIAGGMDIVKKLIEDVLTDGTIFKSEKFDKEGKILGHEIKSHPSLFPLMKMIEALNITPEAFMMTPKEIAKNKIAKKATKTFADIMSGIGMKKDDDKEEEEKERER